MTTINIDDKINLTADNYSIVATARCDYGDVLVVDTSTSYLVVTSETAGEQMSATGIHTVQRNPIARVVVIHDYSDKPATEAYLAALTAMAETAMNNIEDF